MDYHLSVEWSIGADRWVIYYTNDEGQRFRIHEVKNADGSFRPLDQRVLDMLERCDMSRKVEDPKYIVSRQLQKAKEAKQREIAKHRDDMRRKSLDLLPK